MTTSNRVFANLKNWQHKVIKKAYTMKALIIDAKREEYSISQIRWTLTVGELEEYDDETPMITMKNNLKSIHQ